jgi:SAM-dependent methyltransferase
MNQRHLEMLASPRWAAMLERELLPWVTSTVDLGDDVLEVGPGPGLTTDLLRQLTPKLTALEIDASLAMALAQRLTGTHVEVINGNAAQTGFPDGRFSAVACFAVLHHVESAATQDQIFHELLRVLRPGGALVGSDGYDNDGTRQAHEGDLFVPMNPDQLPDRLRTIGYTNVQLQPGEYDFRFSAQKPRLDNPPAWTTLLT